MKRETRKKTNKKIALVGNTNVGKSVFFARLTDKYVDVSNYPGTTVEIARGEVELNGELVEVIDTPGINSLIPVSEDERITRDLLFSERPLAVIHVADAKNIRRTLMLTTQLTEAKFPLVLALNMSDEAHRKGIDIDQEKLGEILATCVIETVAITGQGFPVLRNKLFSGRVPQVQVKYDRPIEEALTEIAHILKNTSFAFRATGLMLLAGDEKLMKNLGDELTSSEVRKLKTIIASANQIYSRPLAYEIARARRKTVESIAAEAEAKESQLKTTVAEKLSQITMRPLTGIPILLLVLFAVYMFVGVFGAQVMVDFLESTVFGQYINPWVKSLAQNYLKIPLLTEVLVGPYGLITMGLAWAIAIVLPIVTTFFFAFSILEDSGYIPRLSVMIDRIFRKIGLNGKAILPMVLGLGCDTMATMTTRTLETKRERTIATLLLALGIPCSAQLGVIMGLFGYASIKAFVLWGLVIGSQLLLVGWFASKLIKGRSSEFILEIPPIRLPQLGNVIAKTITRVEWFFKEVLPFFLVGTLLIFIADQVGLLKVMINGLKPLVAGLLDLPEKTAVAFILGFIRRDYGTAGLFALANQGRLSAIQITVSAVVITLFVPCIANYLMIIKERGLKIAVGVVGFIVPFAVLVGAVLNWMLRSLQVSL